MKVKTEKGVGVMALLTCDCGRKLKVWLLPGKNAVYAPCGCGAVAHVDVDYDGHGMATIYRGNLTRVEVLGAS